MFDIIKFFVTILVVHIEILQIHADTLRTVVVLCRHGDRTPTKIYPKDPYSNISIYWPEGLGQITNLGIQHQYELGTWLRKRYDSFLPETYSSKDIYVRSTDNDRTLMSAEANLAGLYPPKRAQIWNKNLLWRPIPVHTLPNEENVIISRKKPCPEYNVLYKQLLESEFFKNVEERHEKLYQFLSNKTGWNITTLCQVDTVLSILSIEKQHNLSLPSWTKGIFPETLQSLSTLCHASFSFNQPLARLRNGPFFDYIFTHFNKVIDNSTTIKFLMFVGHDATLISVLSAMDLYNFPVPEFTASIIWELWQNSKGFYINLVYKNKNKPAEIKLPKCEINCDFSKFKHLLKPVTVDVNTWNKECLVHN